MLQVPLNISGLLSSSAPLDSAVSFKQWSELECEFLPGGLLKEHVQSNLNISDFIATDNVLILQTKQMFLEQV